MDAANLSTAQLGGSGADFVRTSGDEVDEQASTPEAIDEEELSFYVIFYKLTVPTLFGIVTLIGVIGNALVIYTVTSRSDMRRNAVNLLLLNLAASDLTFVVVCVPFTAYHYAAENWTIGEITCKLYQFIVYVTMYVAVYTLVAVAVVRVCKVSRATATSHSSMSNDSSGKPLSAATTRSCTAFRCRCYIRFFACGSCFPADGWDNRSRRAVGVIVATLWLVALVANVPVLFLYRVKTTAEQKLVAATAVPYAYCGSEDELYGRRITLTFFTFAYVAPLMSIATMYFRLLRQLRQKQRETSISSIDGSRNQQRIVVVVDREAGSSVRSTAMNANANAEQGIGTTSTLITASTRNGIRRTTHVTRVLVVVVAVFAVCWLPLHIHLLVVYSGAQPSGRWYQIFRVLAQCLAYSNSCMNPVIYSYVSTDFRRQFGEIMFALWVRICRCVGQNRAHITATGDAQVEDNVDVESVADGVSSMSKRRSKCQLGGGVSAVKLNDRLVDQSTDERTRWTVGGLLLWVVY